MPATAEPHFFVVTDAAPDSTLADVLFETDTAGLFRQIAGGLSPAQHPTIYPSREAAMREATRRLVCARAAAALARASLEAPPLDGAVRVQLLDAAGLVLLDAELA